MHNPIGNVPRVELFFKYYFHTSVRRSWGIKFIPKVHWHSTWLKRWLEHLSLAVRVHQPLKDGYLSLYLTLSHRYCLLRCFFTSKFSLSSLTTLKWESLLLAFLMQGGLGCSLNSRFSMNENSAQAHMCCWVPSFRRELSPFPPYLWVLLSWQSSQSAICGGF